MAELDKVTYFVEGLKPATKMEINYRAPATFEEAWKLAIRYDSAMFGITKIKGTTSNSSSSSKKFVTINKSFNNGYKASTSSATPMELDYVGKGKFHNNNNKGKGYNTPASSSSTITQKGECHRCGKMGHHAKECRAPYPVQQKAKFNNVEEHTADKSSNNNKAELAYLEDNRERLLRFNGKVNGHSALILLDSGASRNFINEKFVQRTKQPTKETKSFSVSLADGTEKEINRAVDINLLQLGNYRTKGIDAQVLNLQRYDMILRKPWLFHANPTID
jgi:hypothetical protein